MTHPLVVRLHLYAVLPDDSANDGVDFVYAKASDDSGIA